jgi:hypothetical protein
MPIFADLIAEFPILGEKSRLSQKFHNNGVLSDLKYIGTIFFSNMLHSSALAHHHRMMTNDNSVA